MLTGFLRAVGPIRVLGAIVALSLGLGACGGGSSSSNSPTTTAATNSAVKVADVAKVGKVLTDPNGMTLYTFKSDTAGKSTCSGSCAATWPPLTTTVTNPVKPNGLAGDLGVITRDDGAKQVTYNGLPLYSFVGDKAAGDANGQGVESFFAASVQAGSATTTSQTTSGSSYGY